MNKKQTLLFGLLIMSTAAFAQSTSYDLSQLLKQKKLILYNSKVSLVDDHSKGGVKLEVKDGGIAWLSNVKFSSGTIEVDLRGKDVFQKSFVGIAFHGTNDSTYEAVYFRPFNFHATDTVRKIHAVQYISEPEFPWNRLRSEQNGIFEKALLNPPDPNNWFHVRIEVIGTTITVFVNDDKVPSLTVSKLNNITTGTLGLWTGGELGGEFANLKITDRK